MWWWAGMVKVWAPSTLRNGRVGPTPTHPTVPIWTHALCVGTSYIILPRKGGTGEKGWFLALDQNRNFLVWWFLWLHSCRLWSSWRGYYIHCVHEVCSTLCMYYTCFLVYCLSFLIRLKQKTGISLHLASMPIQLYSVLIACQLL